MKTLVFSDSHLALPFDQKQFRFLEGIIKPADRVIINGDFWDGYITKFERFVNSPWKHLFPLLKEKRTVYVFGNHDQQRFADARLELFSDKQTERYELKLDGNRYIFEHGHRLLPFGDEVDKKLRLSLKRSTRIADNLEKMLISKTGSRYQRMFRKHNWLIQQELQKELAENDIYLCGHTHSAEFNLKKKFINSGVVKHGLGQYVLLAEGKKPELKQERYH